MNRSLCILLVLVLGLVAQGCTIAPAYVAADRETYEAVAPEYLDYVKGDATLSDKQRERRERAVESWEARIEEGEK